MLGCPIPTYALACEHADAHAGIVPLCSLKMGALRRKYTLNLKMFFLLIREATIICSQYSVSVTLNYAIRAFYVCRLEERGLLSACLASCVLIVLFTFTFYKRNYIFIYIQYSIIIFHFFNRHPLIPLFHIFHPILHLESNHHQPVNFQ